MPFGLEYIAGGAGGGAAAIGSLSFLGPAGMIAGGALSLFSSISKNKQIKKQNEAIRASAISQQQAINENKLNSRVNFYDAQGMAGDQAMLAQARMQNGAGFTSGNSITSTIAASMANVAQDSYGRARNQATVEQQMEYQKQSIVSQARNSMQSGSSPLLATASGALQGYSMGSSLSNAFDSYTLSSARNDALSSLSPMAQQGDTLALAQIQAIQAGGTPSDVLSNGGNNLFTQSFIMNRQIQSLNLEAAQRSVGASGLQLKTMQDYSSYKNGIFNSYNASSGAGQFLPNNYIKLLGGW